MAVIVLVVFSLIVVSSLVAVSSADPGDLAGVERHRACQELPDAVSISC